MDDTWRCFFDLGARQHQVVSVAQAVGLGLSESTLRQRARREGWAWPQASVVAMPGSTASLEGQAMAGVLACGEGSLVGGRAAARLHGLPVPEPLRLDVVVAHGRGGKSLRPPARVVRSRLLADIPAGVVASIPVVGRGWSLVDVCAELPPSEVPGPFLDATQSGKVRIGDLHDVLDLRRRVNNRALMVQLVRDAEDGIQSVFERVALPILVSRGLPRPSRQVPVRTASGVTLHLDLGYPEQRVGIELLGLRAHRTRRQLRDDVRRLNLLRRSPFEIVWVEWTDLYAAPGKVVDQIAGELAKATSRPRSRIGTG